MEAFIFRTYMVRHKFIKYIMIILNVLISLVVSNIIFNKFIFIEVNNSFG